MQIGNATSVSFDSKTGDHFRLHLHSRDGMIVNKGTVNQGTVSALYPSAQDYINGSRYTKYGIANYASAINGTKTELYCYRYTYGEAKYWKAIIW